MALTFRILSIVALLIWGAALYTNKETIAFQAGVIYFIFDMKADLERVAL